jgi:EAL domain-containing protein (putative c-di-GMP-specific phosphodiesterase class I)/GGDEF domain-containing protein
MFFLSNIIINKNVTRFFIPMLSMAIMLLIPHYGFAEIPEMLLGTIADDTHNTGIDILRAFRGAIFIALIVLCYKTVKTGSKLAIAQIVWLLTTAILSVMALNTDRYVGVPDFSYFSTFIFTVAAINIYASAEYLRRIIVGHNKDGLLDNAILIISVLCIAVITIVAINTPMLAADIILSLWAIVIVVGTIIAIFHIVDKSSHIDLPLLGWIPVQIGLVMALGVGTNGSIMAVITSITAWSSVILGHIFLGLLTYLRTANNTNTTMLQTHPNTDVSSDDSVSLIVDKAVFRLRNDKQKIILNEACAKMLHISGRKSEFSIDAFKGLVAIEYHPIIDKMITNKINAPEVIKFHSCPQKGFIQPLQLKASVGDTDTLFLYQEINHMMPISTIHTVETDMKADFSPHSSLAQDRRKLSDMMYFIHKITDMVASNQQSTGDYVLLLLKIQYYDDWQVILGVSQTHQLVKEITEMIENNLNRFDNLIVKNFSGDMIGIFCYSMNTDTEIEQLKLIIHKHFETPINLGQYNIFVNFHTGISKTPANNPEIHSTPDNFTHLITTMIDFAKRDISLYQPTSLIDARQLSFPAGSNIIQLSSDLRYAPERGQINAYYAPIMDLKTRDIIGFNISAIWRHPDFGVITDDLLDYLSERCTMENTINRLVIAKAIEGMVKLYRSQKMPIMSFNISRKLALGASIDEEIKNLCTVLKISPSLFRLEFAPDCLSDNSKWLAGILSDLKAIGVTTVLNGFGSAKGQLSSLSSLAFDRVIIDSGFSENIIHNERQFFALKSLTTMLKNMAIKADIKNVISKDALKLLRDAGISNISGTVIGNPMPAERAVNVLTKNYEVTNMN